MRYLPGPTRISLALLIMQSRPTPTRKFVRPFAGRSGGNEAIRPLLRLKSIMEYSGLVPRLALSAESPIDWPAYSPCRLYGPQRTTADLLGIPSTCSAFRRLI